MIGHIESYDPETKTGVIVSENKQYAFHLDDWIAQALPEAGDDIHFEADGSSAKSVNLAGAFLEKPKAVKYKYLAAFLGVFFGILGLHRLYLGHYRIALAQIALSAILIPTGFMVFAPQWGFLEGVLIFAGHINKDAKGRPLK